MCIRDSPSDNVIEIKTMVNPDSLFSKEGDFQNILGVRGITVAHQQLKQNLKKLEDLNESFDNESLQAVIKSSRHFLQCLDDAKIEF